MAIENYGTGKITSTDLFLRDAFNFLNDRKDASWVLQAWFQQKDAKFYKGLTPEQLALVLQNVSHVRKVDYRVEQVLSRLAERHLEAVWDFFAARLHRESDEDIFEDRFEAVPFKFHGLEKELSKDPQLAIRKGLSWFSKDSTLFQYRGGRLLSNIFPKCTQEFATALANLVSTGGDTEAEFALEILPNYEGDPSIYVVLKEIVSRYPDDEHKMNTVRVSIDSTGVVTGEMGFADALRNRKVLLSTWLTDGRPTVMAFAERHINELNLRIAAEHRRAETDSEMRKRNFSESGD